MLRARIGSDRHAVGEQHHVRIRNPVGRGNHDFIARIDQRQDQVEDRLLRAGRHQDLTALVLEPVLAFELGDDRVLEIGGAFDRRVAREALADRFDAGVRDVRGRVEIGLAGAEADDVLAFRLELRDAAREGDGRGGLDALDAF